LEANALTKKRVEYTDEVGRHDRHEVTENFYAYWDCSKCSHESILGNVKSCPECGADKTTEKYRPPHADEPKVPITNESAAADGIDLREHFSDETCRFCGADLKPGTQICPKCHAPLSDPAYVHRICPACERRTNDLSCPDCGHGTTPISESKKRVEPIETASGSAATQFDYTPLKLVLGIGAIVIFIAALAFLLWPKRQTATVTAINWQSFVRVQEYQYNHHEDWSLPAGADLNGTSQEIHHYVDVPIGTHEDCHWEKVADGSHQECSTSTECHTETQYSGSHTECFGDGSCSSVSDYDTVTVCEPVTDCDWVTDYRDERRCETVTDYRKDPVYQTRYSYHVWEWVTITPLTRTGTELPIYWADSTDLPENQRAVDQDASCWFTFTVEKKDIDQEVDCDELTKDHYQIGANWQVRLIGNNIVSKKYIK